MEVRIPLPSLGGYPIGLPIGTFDCGFFGGWNCSDDRAVGDTFAAGITGQPFISADERRHADTTAYNEGYVSIVPFRNDLTGRFWDFIILKKLAD
jgi:hypothetical protein